MPKATPRKPSGAAGSFSLSKGQTQCGVATILIAVIIGLSHHFSPSENAAVPAAAVKGASVVTALDDTNFDKFMQTHPDGVLVDFYTNSCKFCVKLAPEYEKAAKELQKGGPPLASVDSETGAALVQKFEVTRFPTVLWFWKGQKVLELPRASEKPAAKIVEWSKWATTPAVQELDTRAEFDEAMSTLRSTLHAKARLMVAFNREGSAGLREAFEAAAQRHRHTTVFLYIREGNSASDSTLKALAPEEANDENYQGALVEDDVVQWVKESLEKAKPSAIEAKAPEDSKPAATKAMEQVQKALQNAEAAKEHERDEANDGKE